ncbi:septum site-determining protein MinC, partial [Acinetobacter baumannii 15827]
GILGDEARAIQFPVLPADQPLQRIKPTAEQVAIVEKPSSAQASVETKKPLNNNAVAHITSYHDEILRTGQSLVQDQGDIILKAGMNSGSEVIASGNIHIYGTVRGRVIAGAGGHAAARIFCQSLEAELVSIAGTYCVADDIPKHVVKKPVHIYLNEKQELEFEALEL